MVAFRRLSEVGEPARLCPIELACVIVVNFKSRRKEHTPGRTRVDDHASDRCAVTANPLRCTMNDNVGTVVDWAEEVAFTRTSVLTYAPVLNVCSPPIPKVLSTIKGTPWSCATFASSGRGATLYFGFPMDSTKMAFVLSSIAAANAAGSELSTNLTPMSNRFK